MKFQCVVLIFLFNDIFCDKAGLHVEISDGKLMGSLFKSEEGRDFVGFQGIPYAEPPVGKLRFKSPVPKKPWSEVKDATRPHAVCPQKDIYLGNAMEGSEDCLFLNVYTPKISRNSEETLPVMVFFHGGGFFCGSGNSEWYDPAILLDQDIVLVTVNYRLGALGFLSTGDEVCPGNYGLKDQSLALRWVRKNIEHFGGNPNSVTIFGQSAGGASVHLHMFSPLSKGLFHRGISQSGTGFNVWAIASTEASIENTKKLAESVNCSRSTNMEMIECLRYLDPSELMKEEMFLKWGLLPMMPFRAVVEPPSSESFLVQSIDKSLGTESLYEVPWIVGLTKDEGLFMSSVMSVKKHLVDELNDDFSPIDFFFSFHETEKYFKQARSRITDFYLDNKVITLERDFRNITNMFSDIIMTSSTDLALRKHLRNSMMPIYTYLFAYEAGVSFSKELLGLKANGVCHSDDLRYLFRAAHKTQLFKDVTEEDRQVKNLITNLWANFAKEGNPTPDNFNPEIERWKAIQSEEIEYYLLDSPSPKMKSGLFEDRVKFWRTLQSEARMTPKRDEL